MITTIPLGCMKTGDVRFVPPLPKSKQGAIDRLGTSLLDKLALEFEEVFWDPDMDTFNLVQDEWSLCLNIYKHCTGKPCLMMFNYADTARKFAKYTDEELVRSAMKALKIMFPGAPDWPKHYLRTNWSEDIYAKQSYTFNPIGSSIKDFDILGQSIGSRVHFAGEHTCGQFIGCTQTAILSGYLAAEKLIGQYVRAYTFLAFLLTLLSVLPICGPRHKTSI